MKKHRIVGGDLLKHSTFTILILLLLQAGVCAAGSGQSDPIAVIEVSSDELTYRDAIVMVELPDEIKAWRQLQLVDKRTGDRVPVQLESGDDGHNARLWFVIDEDIPVRATRSYELYYGNPAFSRNISLLIEDTGVQFLKGGNVMFRYNHNHVIPPSGVDPRFILSGYIHPVYSPSGLLVTEDFPGDHLHHKGVWFPWTRTEFEGREIDFWNLRAEEGTVQFAGFEALHSGPVFAGFRAKHEFVDLTQPAGGKTALNEIWDVRAWDTDDSYYLWDLTSTQRTATESPLELLEYRYGGLGFRGAEEWKDENHVILSSEGHTKADGHTERSRWVAHSGEIVNGEWATVVIMVHPENERFPEPMRIWASGGSFFCYSPVQLGDWTLEPGNDYQFRYRFLIHDGPIDEDKAEQMWQQFARPVQARIQLK